MFLKKRKGKGNHTLEKLLFFPNFYKDFRISLFKLLAFSREHIVIWTLTYILKYKNGYKQKIVSHINFNWGKTFKVSMKPHNISLRTIQCTYLHFCGKHCTTLYCIYIYNAHKYTTLMHIPTLLWKLLHNNILYIQRI